MNEGTRHIWMTKIMLNWLKFGKHPLTRAFWISEGRAGPDCPITGTGTWQGSECILNWPHFNQTKFLPTLTSAYGTTMLPWVIRLSVSLRKTNSVEWSHFPLYLFKFLFFNLLVFRERGEGKGKERKKLQFVVPFMDPFTGWFL